MGEIGETCKRNGEIGAPPCIHSPANDAEAKPQFKFSWHSRLGRFWDQSEHPRVALYPGTYAAILSSGAAFQKTLAALAQLGRGPHKNCKNDLDDQT